MRTEGDTTESRGRMLLQRRPHIAAAFQEAAAAATVSWNRKLAGLSKGSNHPCKLHEQVTEVRGQGTPGIVQRPNSNRSQRRKMDHKGVC